MEKQALIVGVGDGLSAALARRLQGEGYQLILAARNVDKLAGLQQQTNAQIIACDAADPSQVSALLAQISGHLTVAIYNPSARVRGPVADLDPSAVLTALKVTAFGAFLFGQAAAAKMLDQTPDDGRRGTILFTGASAGVKGFPQSAPFAMGKFAQRGLAQSMSRELHPKGIHVAWINIDGSIDHPSRATGEDNDTRLSPKAIADSYFHLINQHRSAWSEELALRPWVENF